jgi:hypothetical protein
MLVATVPAYLVVPIVLLGMVLGPRLPRARIGPVPLLNIGGLATNTPGLGLGVVALGGAAFGAIAMGGFAFGLIAVGGGAVGVVAIGGGSVGVLAVGGGAVGYVAVGGGATGYYALGQRAYGKHALGLNRQDPEAVEFFRRYIPGLNRAVTNPMPVLPLPAKPPAT